MARRAAFALLLASLLVVGCGDGPDRPRADPVITRAAAWLWSQQGEDGGWHSDTYGLLRSGQSLTPFVLDALLALPEHVAPRPEGGVARAVAFLETHTDVDGALGLADPDLADYPCYATASAVQVLGRLDDERHDAWRRRMGRWLLGQQLGDANGWTPSDDAYGAWGMGGVKRTPPNAGHIDLSMTRYVLEALAPMSPKRPEVRAARRAGRHFLERVRVRGEDPTTTLGFYFTPVLPEKNKAGPREGGGYEPYGTTTADGILALLALGVGLEEPKVTTAVDGLAAAHRVDRTPGPATLVESGWADATVFYYRAASAQVFARAGVKQAPAGRDWRADLVAALAAAQKRDGHFANDANRMKEDDPLISTAFALRALTAARR